MAIVRGLVLTHLFASWLVQADRSDMMVLDVDADVDGLTRDHRSSLADLRAVESQSRSLISYNRSLSDSTAQSDVFCKTLTIYQDVNRKLYAKQNELPKVRVEDADQELAADRYTTLTGEAAARACCSAQNVREARIRRGDEELEAYLKRINYASLVSGCEIKDGVHERGCNCEPAYVLHMVKFHDETDAWKDDGTNGIVGQSLLNKFKFLEDRAKDINADLKLILDTNQLNTYAVDAIHKARAAANLTHQYTSNLMGLQHGGKLFVQRLNDYHRGNNFDVFAALNDGSLSALDDAYKRYVKRHGQGDAEFTAFKTRMEDMGHKIGRHVSGEKWYDSHGELHKLIRSVDFIEPEEARAFQEGMERLVTQYTPDQTGYKLQLRIDEFYKIWGEVESKFQGRSPAVANQLKKLELLKKECIRWLFEEENRYLTKKVSDEFPQALKWYEALSYIKDLDEVEQMMEVMPFFVWSDGSTGSLVKRTSGGEWEEHKSDIEDRYIWMRERWEDQTKNQFLVYTGLGRKEQRDVQKQVEDGEIPWDYLPLALMQIFRVLQDVFPNLGCPMPFDTYEDKRKELMTRLFDLVIVRKATECPKDFGAYCTKLLAARLNEEYAGDWRNFWPDGTTTTSGDTTYLNVEDKLTIANSEDVASIWSLSQIDSFLLQCDPRQKTVIEYKKDEEEMKDDYVRYLFQYERDDLRQLVEKRLEPNPLALFQTIEYKSNADDVLDLLRFPQYVKILDPEFIERYRTMRKHWQERTTIPFVNTARPGKDIPKDSDLGVLQILMKLPLNLDKEKWSKEFVPLDAGREKRMRQDLQDKVRQVRKSLYYDVAMKTSEEMPLEEKVTESDKDFAKFHQGDDSILLTHREGRPDIVKWEDLIHITKQEFQRWLYESEKKALRAKVRSIDNGVGPGPGEFEALDNETDEIHIQELFKAGPLKDLDTAIPGLQTRYLNLRRLEEQVMTNHPMQTHRTLMTLPLKYDTVYMQARRNKLAEIAKKDDLGLEKKRKGVHSTPAAPTDFDGSVKIWGDILNRFEAEKGDLGSDWARGRDQVVKARDDYNKQSFLKENKLLHDILAGPKGVSRKAQSVWQYFEEEEDFRNVMDLLNYVEPPGPDFYGNLATTQYKTRYQYLREHFNEGCFDVEPDSGDSCAIELKNNKCADRRTDTNRDRKCAKTCGVCTQAVGLPYQKYRIVIKETIDLDSDLGVLKMLMALPYAADGDALSFTKVSGVRRQLFDLAVADQGGAAKAYKKTEKPLVTRLLEADALFQTLKDAVNSMDINNPSRTAEQRETDKANLVGSTVNKTLEKLVNLDRGIKSVESDYKKWLVKRENKFLYEKMVDAARDSTHEKYLTDYESFKDYNLQTDHAKLFQEVNKLQNHLNRGLTDKETAEDHMLKECQIQTRYLDLRKEWIRVTGKEYESHKQAHQSQVKYNMQP